MKLKEKLCGLKGTRRARRQHPKEGVHILNGYVWQSSQETGATSGWSAKAHKTRKKANMPVQKSDQPLLGFVCLAQPSTQPNYVLKNEGGWEGIPTVGHDRGDRALQKSTMPATLPVSGLLSEAKDISKGRERRPGRVDALVKGEDHRSFKLNEGSFKF